MRRLNGGATVGSSQQGNTELIARLRSIRSLEELEAELGELTPEEEALLASVDLDSPPTREELAFLGPDFVERVKAHMRARRGE